MVVFTRVRRWIENWHKKPFRQIGNAFYWLRTHTYNRYHILDLRSTQNGYSWGWLDRCEGILFANMAILVDFIEKEKAFEGHVDWRSAEEVRSAGETENDPGGDASRNAHSVAKKEILEIYKWWKTGRKEEHDALEAAYDRAHENTTHKFVPCKPEGYSKMVITNSPSKEAVEGLWRQKEALEQKDEDMMIRLVKVRGYMWT